MTLFNIMKIVMAVILLLAIAGFALWGPAIGMVGDLPDLDKIHGWITKAGIWGPILIAGLLAIAILISPIPSAPIALAAGAAYGHGWGTLYVLAGSTLGAVAAFMISRFLGYEFIHRKFGEQLSEGLLGSQKFLMWTIFASRLMPFISFDIISYAAGLTSLSFWRFTIATIAGIAPASFALAHLGGEMVTGESTRILLAVLVLGLFTAIPVLVKLIFKKQRH